MMAVDWNKLKIRYLQDDISIRLGGIASNLSRAESLLCNGSNEQVALQLIRECQFFIEWSAPAASLAIATELVELQRQLSYWHYHWSTLWSNPDQHSCYSSPSSILVSPHSFSLWFTDELTSTIC